MRFRLRPMAITLAASALSWGILFALFPPAAQDFPLADDWAFSHGAFRFASEGRIDYAQWAAMPLLGQWLWAWPFIRIFGASHATVRASVIILSWIGLAAFANCLRTEGVSESRAALAAAVLAFHPMFYLLSGTFMSDVPALSFSLIAFALYAKAFVRDRLLLLLGATIVACVGVSTRQTCIAVPVAAGISMAAFPALRRRLVWWALIVVPVLVGFAVHWWFVRQPSARPVDPRRVNNLFLPFIILYLFFHFGGLAVLPIVPAQWRPASWLAFVFSAAAMSLGAGGMLMDPYVGADEWFPYVAGIFTTAGAYASESNTLFWGDRPILFDDTARVVITVIGCVAGAWLAARLLSLLSDGYRPRMLVWFALLQIPFILIAPYMFDRYFLVAVPAALLIAVTPLSGPAWRWLPAIMATSLLALFSFSLMHDWLAWNEARWDLGRAAMRKQIPWNAISGRFEWDGWWRLQNVPLPPGDGRQYALSFSPLENTRIVETKAYTQWLPPGHRKFYLLEMP